jgi:hypothetical protein
MIAVCPIRFDPFSAHIYRGVLEAHGVRAVVWNDVLSSVQPMFFWQECRVVIAEEDREAAAEIVNAPLEQPDLDKTQGDDSSAEVNSEDWLPPLPLLLLPALLAGLMYLIGTALLLTKKENRYSQLADVIASESSISMGLTLSMSAVGFCFVAGLFHLLVLRAKSWELNAGSIGIEGWSERH